MKIKAGAFLCPKPEIRKMVGQGISQKNYILIGVEQLVAFLQYSKLAHGNWRVTRSFYMVIYYVLNLLH